MLFNQRLKILRENNPLLREISRPITMVNAEMLNLAQQMKEIMRKKNGLGLAAVQVGQPIRLVIVSTQLRIR